MVLEAVSEKHCGQTQQIKRYGSIHAGIQRYRCYDYERTARLFSNLHPHKANTPLIKQQITQMVLNGAGIRDTARVLGANRNTAVPSLKKTGTPVR